MLSLEETMIPGLNACAHRGLASDFKTRGLCYDNGTVTETSTS